MEEYAEWTILIASTFSKSVESLIMFKDTIYTMKKSDLKSPRKVMETLLNLEFYGLTDIVKALNHVYNANFKSKCVVLISDLKQTVKSTLKPHNVIEKLVKAGRRVIVITPSSYDYEERSNVERVGGKVVKISSYKDLVKILSKILKY